MRRNVQFNLSAANGGGPSPLQSARFVAAVSELTSEVVRPRYFASTHMNAPGYVSENVGEDLDYGMSQSEVRAILGDPKSLHQPEDVIRPGDLFCATESIFHFNDESFDHVWAYGVTGQANHTTYVGFTAGRLAEIWNVIDEQTGPDETPAPEAYS